MGDGLRCKVSTNGIVRPFFRERDEDLLREGDWGFESGLFGICHSSAPESSASSGQAPSFSTVLMSSTERRWSIAAGRPVELFRASEIASSDLCVSLLFWVILTEQGIELVRAPSR